jgi:long-chain-fatty-acid--[acyl-carrier-protein] ligase
LNTGAEILEGYGITECSPVLTINRPGQSPEGVGAPLASVTLKVVDIDTHQDCPQGERGLVLAKGPSIFSGYLGGAPNPFVEVDGELWYNTGDLGIMNASGQLTLAGRMKRFVKIAGEMVSLPAMEAALAEMDGVDEDGPFFALHAKEREGERPVLTLFSTMETELEAINAHLRKSGFANVCKVHRLECVKELPMLGTGKVNLGALDKMAKALEEKVVASV